MRRRGAALSEIEQYILLFLSNGEKKRFSQIYNYLRSKGFKISGQYLISKLNRLIRLKFVFPRPHPTRPKSKTYQITPLHVRIPEDHAVVIHSPAFKRPVIIYPEEYKDSIDSKKVVQKGYEKIVEKLNNGDIDHETLIELLIG